MVRARIGFALLAFALAGCAKPPVSPENPSPFAASVEAPSLLGAGARDESPAWSKEVIPGCSSGYSGPTLNPGDAIRNAQAEALGQFAEAKGVRISSISVDDGGSVHSMATFVSEAELSGVRVVAIETQRTGRADDPTARVTHALACELGREPRLSRRDVPAWVLDARNAAGRNQLCAVGISGPTFDKDDAPRFASRDAARALAAVRSVSVSHAAADIDMRAYIVLKSDARVSEDAVEAMMGASTEQARWVDADGYGPLALPRTTFVLRCTGR